MNYLAHLFLSGTEEGLMMGNFLADMLKKKETDVLPEHFQKGIQLHRTIDHFTDNHVMVKKGVQRLYGNHRRYGAVLIDVFYDYILSQNWTLYSDIPLDEFANEVYSVLLNNTDNVPARTKNIIEGMVENDWLVKYSHLDGIQKTINRIKKRASHPEYFEKALTSLDKDYDLLKNEFHSFFPEIIAFLSKNGFV